jgi:hypothetical protein
MFSLLRWLFVVLLCLGGIGLYRGWFSVSNPSRDADGSHVSIGVTVDTNKVETDVEAVKEKVAAQVAQRLKEHDKAQTPASK